MPAAIGDINIRSGYSPATFRWTLRCPGGYKSFRLQLPRKELALLSALVGTRKRRALVAGRQHINAASSLGYGFGHNTLLPHPPTSFLAHDEASDNAEER